MKALLKRIIGPRLWGILKRILGKHRFDEIDLIYSLLNKRQTSRVMIDVGAHHGDSLIRFATTNWQVIAFEPDPTNRKVLETKFGKLDNVTISSSAVSSSSRANVTFYSSKQSSGISSLTPFHHTHRESAIVETVTLEQYLTRLRLKNVGFLKVDTEGHDLLVLRGFPWQKIKPEVILCEFEDRKTKILGYTYYDLASFLVGKGYDVFLSEWHPIIEYGKSHKWNCLKIFPADLDCQSAWGNMIAVPSGGDLSQALHRKI